MKGFFLGNKLFWISELVALVILLGCGIFIWAVDKTIPVVFILYIQTPILLAVVTAINWAWTWNRRWSQFYW